MNSLGEFLNRFGSFARDLPDGYLFGVETRNPNYLKRPYFEFLAEAGLRHVFLHGYYMPPIFEVYRQFRNHIRTQSVIRLLGSDRQGIEQRTGKSWDAIVSPRDKDLASLAEMLTDLTDRDVETFLYVNNHFEGSAPRTIARIETLLA
jgi:uncharacterized protein YecE (DUF72 family)